MKLISWVNLIIAFWTRHDLLLLMRDSSSSLSPPPLPLPFLTPFLLHFPFPILLLVYQSLSLPLFIRSKSFHLSFLVFLTYFPSPCSILPSPSLNNLPLSPLYSPSPSPLPPLPFFSSIYRLPPLPSPLPPLAFPSHKQTQTDPIQRSVQGKCSSLRIKCGLRDLVRVACLSLSWIMCTEDLWKHRLFHSISLYGLLFFYMAT